MAKRGVRVSHLQNQHCVIGPFERLTRDEECERILEVYGADRYSSAGAELDRQFRTIHNRAQVLLTICGVLLSASVLLMTGKIIGRPDFLLRELVGYLLVAAGIAEISAAAVIVGGVLSVRYMTQLPGDDVRAWVMTCLTYRDDKTRAYRVGIVLVLVSMMLYQSAAAIALVQM